MERIAVLRYSKALFEIAVESNLVEEYNKAAKDMLTVLTSEKELTAVMNNPSIPVTERMGVVKTVFSGKVPEAFMGILDLLFKRGRQKQLPDMLRHFEQLYKEYKRVADAKLYSATQLSPQKLSEISGILSKKLDKIINLELVVDPSLLAGFRVEVDGFVFDSSIKNQLAGLKKQLLGAERYSALY